MGPVGGMFFHKQSQIWLTQSLRATQKELLLSSDLSLSLASFPSKLKQAARRRSANLKGNGTFSNSMRETVDTPEATMLQWLAVRPIYSLSGIFTTSNTSCHAEAALLFDLRIARGPGVGKKGTRSVRTFARLLLAHKVWDRYSLTSQTFERALLSSRQQEVVVGEASTELWFATPRELAN